MKLKKGPKSLCGETMPSVLLSLMKVREAKFFTQVFTEA